VTDWAKNQHFILAVADSTPREQWVSTILHELQHGIQRIEGFATGGSPESIGTTSEATSKSMRGFVNFADLMEQAGSEPSAENARRAGMTEQEAQTVERLVESGLWEQNIKTWRRELLSPSEQYRRLAGEVEARNTQARQGMTDEQRRATAPSATQDVADSDVIVTFNGKEMHNAPMPANAQRESTAVTPANAPSALAKVQSAIEGMFEGIDDVRQRIAQGTTVVNDASELPENLRQGAQDARAQALYDPYSDRVYMIASRIEAGQEKAVWLHEVFHKRGKDLLREALPRLHQAVQRWASRPANSVERQIYEAAHERATNDGNYEAEFLAYAIEEAVNRGVQPDLKGNITSAGYWLGRVREAFASVVAKLTGVDIGTKALNAQDLVAAAYGAAGLEVQANKSQDGIRDQRKARILQGEPVATLRLEDAPTGGYADIARWAGDLFAKQGGKAVSPEIGEVILNEQSARDSMAHGGANAAKKVAFAAVKNVIEQGALVYQASAGKVDSFYLSAPVQISGKDNIVTVLVHRDPNTQRMYLHGVALKESLLNPRVSAVDAKASELGSSTNSEGSVIVANGQTQGKAQAADVARELQRLLALDAAQTGQSKPLNSQSNTTGHAQPLDEPVLTPTGWRSIGELQVGDEVYAHDGSITQITGVYPQGEQAVYKVELDDGLLMGLEKNKGRTWLEYLAATNSQQPQALATLGDILYDGVDLSSASEITDPDTGVPMTQHHQLMC
jgi:hypothetical protein